METATTEYQGRGTSDYHPSIDRDIDASSSEKTKTAEEPKPPSPAGNGGYTTAQLQAALTETDRRIQNGTDIKHRAAYARKLAQDFDQDGNPLTGPSSEATYNSQALYKYEPEKRIWANRDANSKPYSTKSNPQPYDPGRDNCHLCDDRGYVLEHGPHIAPDEEIPRIPLVRCNHPNPQQTGEASKSTHPTNERHHP